MSDHKDEIASISEIIAKVDREAYARGVKDTIARYAAIGDQLLPPDVSPAKPNGATANQGRGRPATSAINVVKDAVFAKPGMKGIEVVEAAQKIDSKIPDRTVRSCLRRLKYDTHEIWQRDKRWYPKKRKEHQDANGETASGPSPH